MHLHLIHQYHPEGQPEPRISINCKVSFLAVIVTIEWPYSALGLNKIFTPEDVIAISGKVEQMDSCHV